MKIPKKKTNEKQYTPEEKVQIQKAIEMTNHNIARNIKNTKNSTYDNAITRSYQRLIEHGIH